MENVITVSRLTKDYGQGRGVFDFNFQLERGKIYGLVGTNGSGKTTTLRHLMGFLKPDAGECKILGYDCWKDAAEIKKHVSYVPGDINFPDVGTGNAFLKLQAEYLGIQDLRYTNYLIDLFKLDTSAPLRRMSKGMKQKTALVACFMAEKEIILLDEPSTGLDPLMRDVLVDLVKEQRRLGRTVFMSSHIFKELEDTCDGVLFIKNGKIVNVVNRSQYDPNMPKQYKIGFETVAEMTKFAQISAFRPQKIKNQFRHLTVTATMEQINELFKELQNFNVRYIRNMPYTLEWYYEEIIVKGGSL